MPASRKQSDTRAKELAKIHTLAKQLGLNEDDYRAMLKAQTGLDSAKDMQRLQRVAVITHLQRQLGLSLKDSRPHNTDNNPQLQKIEALLLDSNTPWSYAHKIAKQMYRKDHLTFCSAYELRAVIAALTKRNAKLKGENHD